MKRPLLYLLIFYILGILIGQYISDKIFIVLFFAIIILCSIILYRIYKWVIIFTFILCTVLGFLLTSINTKNNNNLNEKFVTVNGIVTNIDYTNNGRQKIILKTNYITYENVKINDSIKIQAIFDIDEKVEYNQIITIKGTLLDFNFKRNPGGFDEKLYMQTKKIKYKMFANIIKKEIIINNLNGYFYKIHLKFNNIYSEILPNKQASILNAMLLGDKGDLDDSIKEIYKKAGISHILAISGLHISILYALLWLILKYIGLNSRISSGILLIILSLYCMFTGNSVSTVRSVVMISIVLLGSIIYRESDIYTSIGASALIILLYQPLYLFNIGFQLSFGAVTGIIILSPVLERLKFIPRKVKPYIISTLAASLSTYPIIAFHFNTISIIGLIVNVLLLPFASILVALGFLSGLVGMFSITISKFICGIVYYILILYEFVCKTASSIPFSEILIAKPNIIIILIYYIIVISIALYYYKIKSERLILKKYLFLFITLNIIISLGILFLPKSFEVVYLDVGQGDSIAIHTTDNKNILIDGGGNIFKNKDENNTGNYVILPYLKYKGIKKLDYVFISHPDGDHILGILEIIDYIDIDKIIVSDNNILNKNELYINLENKAKTYSIPIIKIKQGDIININKDLYIQCLYPYKSTYVDTYNNSSLVIYMKYKNNIFAFTGDIEKEAEYSLINKYDNLHSNVLKIPHHGSKTSSTYEFVKSINPSIAIVSSGKNNSYGHPHKQVIDRYKSINCLIYNTANEGAITIKSNGDKIFISTMKEREQK